MPMSYTASSSVAASSAPDFHTDATSPDAGIFAGVDNAGRSIVDLLTLLFTITGDPPGRDDLLGKAKPTAAQIGTMVSRAERILADLVAAKPESKAVVDAHFSGSDEARRGALCVVLYTMLPLDGTVAVYEWVNAWLNSSGRTNKAVAKHIGPFFVAYHEAVLKLPVATSQASRAVRRVDNFPKLSAAHRDYKAVFAPGKPVNFWGVASFTEDDTVMNNEIFLGLSDEKAIVFMCPALTGRRVSLLSAFPHEQELQPLTPSHFRVHSSCVLFSKLVITLEHVVPTTGSAVAAPPRQCLGCGEFSLVAALADTLSTGRDLPTGVLMTKRDVCASAIALDPRCAKAYCTLAETLSDETETFDLPHQRAMNKRELCLKALEVDERCVRAYNILSRALSRAEEVTPSNGARMNKAQLCLKSIESDPKDPGAYVGLSWALPRSNETVMLPNSLGRADRVELCRRAIALDPLYARAYVSLSWALPSQSETVLLPGGDTPMNKRQLCLKAIEVDDQYAPAYVGLARVLAGGHVKLNGVNCFSRTLCLKAIELDTRCASAYVGLSWALSADETVTLHDGTPMNRRDLCLKAIQFDRRSSGALLGLAQTLSENERVTLPDGELLDAQQLRFRGRQGL